MQEGCLGTTVARPSSITHSHSGGNARARRQNAVALGPRSLSRTKIGANAIPTAPPNRALSASRVDLAGDVERLGGALLTARLLKPSPQFILDFTSASY